MLPGPSGRVLIRNVAGADVFSTFSRKPFSLPLLGLPLVRLYVIEKLSQNRQTKRFFQNLNMQSGLSRSRWAVSAAHMGSLFRRLAAVTGGGRIADSVVHSNFLQGVNTGKDSSEFEASCAGLDGTPWPNDADRGNETDNDKEYFRRHTASPLSEIRMVDTRKPTTRATDGSPGADDDGNLSRWLPEQLDTAEEALERAMRIWRENAIRGDPDTPHGRVLRALRGEWF